MYCKQVLSYIVVNPNNPTTRLTAKVSIAYPASGVPALLIALMTAFKHMIRTNLYIFRALDHALG